MEEIKQEKSESPSTPDTHGNPWVMVFNVITGVGKDEVKRTYKINKNRVLVGSALSSDIRIQQNSVSNVHAIIEMDEQGAVHLYDMASETGVFVNNEKILSTEIKTDDEIKIGFALLTFKRQSLVEAQAQLPEPMVRSSGERKLFLNEKEDYRPLILEDERDVIQIFDYPSNSDLVALQVVLYWDDVILDVQHFSDHEAVTLGEKGSANFLVPGLLEDFPLLSYEGSGYVLQYTDAMSGVVQSGKQLTPLAELRKQSHGTNRLPLKNSDQVKIQFRGITLFINYSQLPPVLRRQRVLERDPFYTRIWFSSLALTAALILLMAKMEKPAPLTVDELPPRVATIIFQPPPPPPPPRPKPVQKPEQVKPEEKKPVEKKPKPRPPTPKPQPKPKAQPKRPVPHKLPTEVKHAAPKAPVNIAKQPSHSGGGAKGEGARHEGAEGAAGKPKAKAQGPHQTAARGTPNSQSAQKSATQGQGNVESFFSGIDGTINKKLAAGSAGANAAAENLRGHGGFTTQGNGGLGEIGNGGGGGGKSMSVSGLGTKGLGDGDSGSKLGRIGSGGDLSGMGRGRPSIEIGGVRDTVIMGGLDKDLVDRIIKMHMDQIRHCYELEANGANSDLHGRVMVRFVVGASGRVSQSGVESTSLRNTNVERCLVGTIQRIVFPEPQGGGIVEISYPFLFAPTFSGN